MPASAPGTTLTVLLGLCLHATAPAPGSGAAAALLDQPLHAAGGLPAVADPAREARLAQMLASIEVRQVEALFAVQAWLDQAGKTAADTAGMTPLRREVWERLHAMLTDADRARYAAVHDSLHARYDHMLGYLGMVLALNMSPPPELRILDAELRAWNEAHGVRDRWTENRLAELGPLADAVRDLHARYPVAALFRRYRPQYEAVGASDLSRAGDVVRRSIDYLRLGAAQLPALERIVIVPHLVGPRGEMGPTYRGIKYDVKGPRQSPVYRAHEFLHSLVAGSTRAPAARERIVAATAAAFARADGTPAAGTYGDPVIWFDECLVRALDAKVMHPDDPQAIAREAAFEAGRGFVLVPDIVAALAEFEASGLDFPAWFPRLLARCEAADVAG